MGLNQQVYLLHLPQTRMYVPMLVPNQRAGKQNCTRPSVLHVTHLTSSHVLSATMYISLGQTLRLDACYVEMYASNLILNTERGETEWYSVSERE